MTPDELFEKFCSTVKDLKFGEVCLSCKLHDGKPRYEFTVKESIVGGKPTSGELVK
jgi:hypothetical protein